jgi:hypothetical protein
MPTFKISQLIAVTSIAGTEELEVNQGGASKKATRSQLIAGLVSAGAVTASGLTMTSGRVLGRTTGATGAIEELSVVPVSLGGTGVSAIPTNGQVLIGNGTGYTPAVLTAGANIAITNGAGSITIAASVGGSSLSGQTDSSTPFETALGHQAGNVNSGIDNTFIGYQAGLSNTSGTKNVALGARALDALTTGSHNIAIGPDALGSLTTTASSNIAIGREALQNWNTTTASYTNIAIGTGALANLVSPSQGGNTIVGNSGGPSMSTAEGNTGIGQSTLFSTTTGNSNTAVGWLSMNSNTTGGANTAIGYRVMQSNTTGGSNVAVGQGALFSNTTSSNSVAVGFEALTASTGASNTALGYQAGDKITTGTQNTVLGNAAGSSGTNDLTTGSNNTIIGFNAAASSATVSNEITLGNSSIATLRCQATTITALSDARDKANIAPLAVGMQFVQYLKPVSFDWAMRDGGRVGVPDMGFIAQDLQEAQLQAGVVIPGLVYESDPEQLGASYGKLLPVLVKALQELSAEVAALKAQIAAS